MDTAGALARPRAGLWPALARFLEADLSRRRSFALLASAFLVSRAPFLGYGYGTDPDAWRVALTGQYLVHHGRYFPSRLPGNPLHELVLAPLVPAGWIATNLATTLISLGGVYLFARIVGALSLPNRGLLTLAFAFTPLLFINSVASMDYMWALTFILGAYLAALKDRPLWAGVLCGIAVGFRLQSVIILLPLAYLFLRTGDWRRSVPMALGAGGVGALAFAPVLAAYGTSFWNYYDASVDYETVLRLLGKESLGILGSLAVVGGLVFSARRLAALPADLRADPQVGVWLLVIAVYFVTFLRLPHEIAYLIPVFPFGYLFLGRYCSRAAMIVMTGAVLTAGLVDITTPGEAINLDQVRSARIGRGLVLSNADTMKNQREFVRDIVDAPVPDHSVVLSGFVYPQLAMRERGRLEIRILERDYDAISMLSDRGEAVDTKRDIHYVWLLTYEAFTALRSQGYTFFLVPDAAGGTAALYDYRPTLFGATFLPLDRPAPSQGKGTASTDR